MTVWDVTFTALQPISIAHQVNAQSQWATTNFIPGSTWRGAVAEHWKYAVGFEHPLAQTLIDVCIFHDAHELQTQFTPVYFKAEKGAWDNVVNVLQPYIENDEFVIKSNDRVLMEQNPFKTAVVENAAIGIEMSRTRESTVQGKLYSMTSIAEGTQFTTTALIPEEVMAQLAPEHELTVYIGKKRFSGYGQTRITFTKREAKPQTLKTYKTKDGKTAIAFAAKSATILYDAYLRPTQTIEWAAHIAPLLPSSLQLKPVHEETWGVGAVRSGWQQLWNAPKTDEHVLAAGATYIVTFEQATDEQLRELLTIIEEQGIGERVQEGFGQFVQAPDEILSKPEAPKEKLRTDKELFTADEEGKLYEAAQQLVDALGMNKRNEPDVPLAQWQGLMSEPNSQEAIFGTSEFAYITKRLKSNVRNIWKSSVNKNGISRGEMLREKVKTLQQSINHHPEEVAKYFLKYCARYTRLALKLKEDQGGNQYGK